MKIFYILLLSFGLLSTQTTNTVEIAPLAAAVATWAVVAPSVSLLVNIYSNPLWLVGCLLVNPNDWASRDALGGIVGGTAGTLAAVATYNSLKSAQK